MSTVMLEGDYYFRDEKFAYKFYDFVMRTGYHGDIMLERDGYLLVKVSDPLKRFATRAAHLEKLLENIRNPQMVEIIKKSGEES